MEFVRCNVDLKYNHSSQFGVGTQAEVRFTFSLNTTNGDDYKTLKNFMDAVKELYPPHTTKSPFEGLFDGFGG